MNISVLDCHVEIEHVVSAFFEKRDHVIEFLTTSTYCDYRRDHVASIALKFLIWVQKTHR